VDGLKGAADGDCDKRVTFDEADDCCLYAMRRAAFEGGAEIQVPIESRAETTGVPVLAELSDGTPVVEAPAAPKPAGPGLHQIDRVRVAVLVQEGARPLLAPAATQASPFPDGLRVTVGRLS
jgi:hypothetical protein